MLKNWIYPIINSALVRHLVGVWDCLVAKYYSVHIIPRGKKLISVPAVSAVNTIIISALARHLLGV
jgi:hypothetical protein